LEVCRFWLNQTLDCLLKVERAHEGLLGSHRAYAAKYRGCPSCKKSGDFTGKAKENNDKKSACPSERAGASIGGEER